MTPSWQLLIILLAKIGRAACDGSYPAIGTEVLMPSDPQDTCDMGTVESNRTRCRSNHAPANRNTVQQDLNQSTGTTRRVEFLDQDSMVFMTARLAWEAVQERALGCQLIIVTPDAKTSFMNNLISQSTASLQPSVIIDLQRLRLKDSGELSTALWGEPNTSCRAVLIDLTYDMEQMFKFLELHKLDVWPEAWVVIIGEVSKAKDILLHDVFRNTLQPLYLGLQESPDGTSLNGSFKMNEKNHIIKFPPRTPSLPEWDRETSDVYVYSRCLYCDNGEPSVKFLFRWPLRKTLPNRINPFPDQYLDLKGHKFRTVSMPSFPYNDLTWDTDEPETKVTLLDCLDKRLLAVVSSHLNFTYETRAPWDLQWGVATESGNWTGMIGTIQYRRADFITTVAPTPGRNTIIDTTRAYTPDVLAIVSLKPQLLPQYLVIIRPFTLDVWLYVVLSIMVWGFFLWLLQVLRSWPNGENKMTFGRAIFYSWAVFLEDPPSVPPTNATGQVLLGFWLLSCLVVTTGFRSSLVAHLAVQSKTKPIDSFRDLMELGHYEWGMEARSLTGVPLIYFETTTDPVVKYVYKYMKRLKDHKEAFQRVIEGKFAFIVWHKIGRNLIDSYYTDNIGNTPYYISKEGYGIVPYFGWGYGKGAPFRNRFNMLMNRVIEAGIPTFWTEDIMASRVRQNRREVAKEEGSGGKNIQIKQVMEENILSLNMSHMTGVFLVLFLGFFLSGLALAFENLHHFCKA